MRTKGLVSRVLLVTVFLHFALGHGDAFATVLCLGSDGHVAIENAEHNHCLGPLNLHQAMFQSPDATCQPCVDIPVAGNSEDQEPHKPLPTRGSLPEANTSPLTTLLAVLPLESDQKLYFFPRSLTKYYSPWALRSVVLLI